MEECRTRRSVVQSLQKPRHTKDNCFKLHGKEAVLSRIGGFKSRPPKTQAYFSSTDQGEAKSAGKTESIGADISQLNAEEMNKLKNFLKTLQYRACSLAQQGKLANSECFSAFKTAGNTNWVLDSGATDHMTPHVNSFDTYQPLVSPKQIVIANGTTVPIAG